MCCNAGLYGCDWGWCGFRREFARLKIEKESPSHQRHTLSREPLLECSCVSAVRSKVGGTSTGIRVRCESRSNCAVGISKPCAETIDKKTERKRVSVTYFTSTHSERKIRLRDILQKEWQAGRSPGKVPFGITVPDYHPGFKSF